MAGLATLAFFLAMAPAEERMRDDGPRITSFELAGSEERAEEVLAEWGEDGRDAARESLWIDFGFLLAYGTFLTLAVAAVRDLARSGGWPRLAAVGGVVVFFGGLAAVLDAIEDVCLLLVLDGAGGALPALAAVFAALKFLLAGAAVAYLVAGLALPAGRYLLARS